MTLKLSLSGPQSVSKHEHEEPLHCSVCKLLFLSAGEATGRNERGFFFQFCGPIKVIDRQNTHLSSCESVEIQHMQVCWYWKLNIYQRAVIWFYVICSAITIVHMTTILWNMMTSCCKGFHFIFYLLFNLIFGMSHDRLWEMENAGLVSEFTDKVGTQCYQKWNK